MEIQDFFTRLIELAWPWTVKAVVSEDGSQRVDVHLECADTAQFPCPLCDRFCPATGYSPPKAWRHLDICRQSTWLHARLPVVSCPEHGKQHPHTPWADTDSTVTGAFEQWIARLAESFGDIKKAAHFAGMNLDQIRGCIRQTPNKTGKLRVPPADVDETILKTSPGLQAAQLSLFGRHNDMSFVNLGLRAFKDLELQKAVDCFEKQRAFHPGGYDVSSWLAAARFLLLGVGEAPDEPRERTGYLCRLWNSFEDHLESLGMHRHTVVADVKSAFFALVIGEAGKSCPDADSLVAGDIPLGYILLQAGRREEAIRSLQGCIAKLPHNAAAYGYLGDAYWLSGKPAVARLCYREGCLIDPASIDWRHVPDEDLKELKLDISFKYGFDSALTLAWLPSHARIEGIFERKVIRLHDGLKEMVHDYLALNKAISRDESPCLRAKLFFRGIILCENRESLKFIKKIDLIDVRRMMKQANPDLFEEFLERISEGRG